MTASRLPRVCVVWAQYAAYHVDRCEALGRRLSDRAEIIAIEMASASRTYAWPPSGSIKQVTKHTLFPGKAIEQVSRWQRFARLVRATRGSSAVLFGMGYENPEIVLAALILRLGGTKVVLMTDSKHDDKPRHWPLEWLKRVLVVPLSAAIVAGRRQADYMRQLGFLTRPVLPGYDTVSVDRIRSEAAVSLQSAVATYTARPFIYVGRFVAKKNLERMVAGYARYVELTGKEARRLRLVGDGPLGPALREQVERLGLAAQVDFMGFRDAREISALLAESLALVLVSTEEQWGLVVNEALAINLPVIVSTPVGARDLLVRDGINGFVIDPLAAEQLAAAMMALATDEQGWTRMAEASAQRAWLGDSERFADAVEVYLFPGSQPAESNVAALREELALSL